MKIKSQKGSITIFVLIALLFYTAFLLLMYAANTNKLVAIKEKSDILKGIYEKNTSDESINNIYKKWTFENPIVTETQIGEVVKDNMYGAYIDLGQNVIKSNSTDDDWKILYKDPSTNTVYAILADYLPNDNIIVSTSELEVKEGTTYGVKGKNRDSLINILEDTTIWQGLIPNSLVNKGIQVKGAPTVELLLASYNQKYNINPPLTKTRNPKFYINNNSSNEIDTLYVSHPGSDAYDDCIGYWTSSIKDDTNNTDIWMIIPIGYLGYSWCKKEGIGLRPVVAIPSNVQIKSTTLNGVTTLSII